MVNKVGLLKYFKKEEEIVVPIDKPEFGIGRSLNSDIRITKDRKVSRNHCCIICDGGEFYIEDNGSSNGTLVNEEPVEERIRLEDSDVIQVGRTKFIFTSDRRGDARTVQIKKKREITFCTECGGAIQPVEIRDGLAEKRGGSYICADCSTSVSTNEIRIAHFEIIKKISQGGFGIVYKARHLIYDDIVAIKMIREGRMTDKTAIKRFMREIRLGMMIEHPNIVKFLDSGEIDGLKYIVMEFCEGRSLANAVQEQGGLTEKFPHVAFQLMDAVEACHNADLVHRDIKPENIILLKDDTLKLIDLGFAKSLDSKSRSILTHTGSFLGTPYYMPPEQVQDASEPDVRGDIYSMGATLYTMLCGIPPVGGKSVPDFIKNLTARRIKHPSEINPGVSKEIDTWLLKALHINPDERYHSVAEFRQAFPLEDEGREERT